MSLREDSPEPGTSREDPPCPACQDTDPECSDSCRHCFCYLCVWDWSLSEPTCPRCQRPTCHRFPQHVALYHEVQDRVYARKRRRARRGSARWHRRRARGSGSSRRRGRDGGDTPDEGRAPRYRGDASGSWRRGRCQRRCRGTRSRREQREQRQGHQSGQRWRSRDRQWRGCRR